MNKWIPTKKWFAAAITGLLTITGLAIESGAWDKPEWSALITLGIALVGAYFKSNSSSDENTA